MLIYDFSSVRAETERKNVLRRAKIARWLASTKQINFQDLVGVSSMSFDSNGEDHWKHKKVERD
jgi:hypothetical protein